MFSNDNEHYINRRKAGLSHAHPLPPADLHPGSHLWTSTWPWRCCPQNYDCWSVNKWLNLIQPRELLVEKGELFQL